MEEVAASSTARGRPRGFDRAQALHSALGVFWRQGYEPASIADLCAAMSISAPSMYAAFGNKAKLFLEAVDHYEAVYWDATWDAFDAQAGIEPAVTQFFAQAAGILSSQDAPCGCMVVLGTTNVSAGSKDVDDALKQLRLRAQARFQARLQKAVAEGELPPTADVEGLGLALNALLQGMSIQARDGTSARGLLQIAAMAWPIVKSA